MVKSELEWLYTEMLEKDNFSLQGKYKRILLW